MTEKLDCQHKGRRNALKVPAVRPAVQEQTPIIVNIVGPPGAGKTTLTKALLQSDPRFITPRRLEKIVLQYHLIKNIFPLLPRLLWDYPHVRWFTRIEMVYLASISAQHRAIHMLERDNRVLVMMDGPLYQLAYFRLFGPPITRNESFQRWCNNWLNAWSKIINLMIWLDAPDTVLFRRVNEREQDVPVKGLPFKDAILYFEQQRQIHRAAVDMGCFHPLTIDTRLTSTADIVSQVLCAISARSVQR